MTNDQLIDRWLYSPRIKNYYNNIECAAEFESLCEEAKQLGVETPILPDKKGKRCSIQTPLTYLSSSFMTGT